MQKINFSDPEIQRIFRENHISRAYLVGSFARGEAHAESDIDILYEKAQGQKFTLMNIGNMRYRLRDITGREIDLVSATAVRSEIRESIESDKVVIYG